MFRKSITILFLVLISTTKIFAQDIYQASASFVPAGTPVSVSLSQAISSEFTRVGETFVADLTSPIYAGGSLVAGPGSKVQGQVVAAEPAGRGGKPGYLDLRLVSIITPDGRRIPLSATVDQNVFKLQADGGRTSHFAKATALGAAGGALSGLIGGAISGGKKGKTTAIGTGIGAGVGILGGAIDKGAELVLTSGTVIPFRLDQAIQVGSPLSQQVTPNYGAPSGGGFADPYAGGGSTYSQQPMQNPYL